MAFVVSWPKLISVDLILFEVLKAYDQLPVPDSQHLFADLVPFNQNVCLLVSVETARIGFSLGIRHGGMYQFQAISHLLISGFLALLTMGGGPSVSG